MTQLLQLKPGHSISQKSPECSQLKCQVLVRLGSALTDEAEDVHHTSASTAIFLAMLLTPPTKCSVLLCAALSSQSSDLAGKDRCAALTSSVGIGQRYFTLNLKFPRHLPFLQRKVSDLEVLSSHRSCCNVPPQRRQKQVLCSSSCQCSANLSRD